MVVVAHIHIIPVRKKNTRNIYSVQGRRMGVRCGRFGSLTICCTSVEEASNDGLFVGSKEGGREGGREGGSTKT